jgi:hypothetical protein
MFSDIVYRTYMSTKKLEYSILLSGTDYCKVLAFGNNLLFLIISKVLSL